MRFPPELVRFFGLAALLAGSSFGLWARPRVNAWREQASARRLEGAPTAAPAVDLAGPADGKSVRVLAFNLQNLFDTTDDPGKADEEFLPVRTKKRLLFAAACGKAAHPSCRTRNWTETALELKLARLAGALEAEQHRGSEILLFSEVENRGVLRRLLRLYRPGFWKTIALIEGPDPRGMDVAVVSDLPLEAEPVLHTPVQRTRGILEARLRAPCGGSWTVLAFHFPSQLGSERGRRALFDRLFELTRAREHAGQRVIAGGDSNMTAENQRDWALRARAETGGGGITHFLGCAECPGTYSYRGRWDFLDWIYFSREFLKAEGAADDVVRTEAEPGAKSQLGREAEAKATSFPAPEARLSLGSIRVPRAGPLQMDATGAPLRFTESNGHGVSDHFPIAGDLIVGPCGPRTR